MVTRIPTADLKGDDGAAGAPGGSDPSFAAWVRDPASLTGQAVAEKIEAIRKVYLNIYIFQSNTAGRATEYSSFLDPIHPRIWQFPSRGPYDDQLIPATEPLVMREDGNGMGPGLQIARHQLEHIGPDDIIILVGQARGSTPLCSNAALAWRWGVAGNLSDLARIQTLEAIAEAEATYPGCEIVPSFFMIGGETDGSNGIDAATFKTDLYAWINGFRTAIGYPDAPWIMGGMVIEGLPVGTRAAIDSVESTMPYEVAHTGWAPGVSGKQNGDNLHYNRDGQEAMAAEMEDEWWRVMCGLSPVHAAVAPPAPVVGVAIADNFNRADSSAIGPSPTGGVTPVLTSSVATTVGIVGNQMKFTSILNPQAAALTWDVATQSGKFTAVVGDVTAGRGGIAIWSTDYLHQLQIPFRVGAGDYRYRIGTRTGGGFTVVDGPFAPIVTLGDVVEVEANGVTRTVKLTVNGTVLFNDTIAAPSLTGKGVSLTTGSVAAGEVPGFDSIAFIPA